MIFKGVTVETGDVVSIQANSIPIPEIRAVVLEVKDGVLDVFSTFLVPLQHNGLFPESDVSQIVVTTPAAQAIPEESRGKQFAQLTHIFMDCRDGVRRFGSVVAAFDGIVIAITDDGSWLTSGAAHCHIARDPVLAS